MNIKSMIKKFVKIILVAVLLSMSFSVTNTVSASQQVRTDNIGKEQKITFPAVRRVMAVQTSESTSEGSEESSTIWGIVYNFCKNIGAMFYLLIYDETPTWL